MNDWNRRSYCAVLASWAMIAGCDVPDLPKSNSAPSQSAGSANSQQGDSNDQQVAQDRGIRSVTDTPMPDPGDVKPVTDQPRPVDAKDPKQGRRSRSVGRMGAVPAAGFYAKHKLIYDSVRHALNLFNASEGRYPNSHEEFMSKIIEFNNIQLPELIEGEEYIYVPEAGDLGLQIRKTSTDETEEGVSEEGAHEEDVSEEDVSEVDANTDETGEESREK